MKRNNNTCTRPEDLLDRVAAVTGFTKEQIRSRSYKPEHVEARRVFCYIARKNKVSCNMIGRVINRSRTTVAYHLQVAENFILIGDKEFGRLLDCVYCQTLFGD